MNTLMDAHKQWAIRPDDERFDSLEAMYQACRASYERSGVATMPWHKLSVDAELDEVLVVGPSGKPSLLTNYSFGQVANKAGAPASYLHNLPAKVVGDALDFGLKRIEEDSTPSQLLFTFTSGNELRLVAATSERYSRVWNWQVIQHIEPYVSHYNLIPGQQTFEWRTGMDHQVRNDNAPKALYASDHDMFAFLMSEDKTIVDPMGQTLRRGIIVSNSEVGDRSLRFTAFLFRDVCANHIIWGAQDVAEIRYRHVGDMQSKIFEGLGKVETYLDSSAYAMEQQLLEARVKIADDKESVVGKLYKTLALPKKTLEAAYDAVVPEVDGEPESVWGMVQGITRISQHNDAFADQREALDREAGKLLEVAF